MTHCSHHFGQWQNWHHTLLLFQYWPRAKVDPKNGIDNRMWDTSTLPLTDGVSSAVHPPCKSIKLLTKSSNSVKSFIIPILSGLDAINLKTTIYERLNDSKCTKIPQVHQYWFQFRYQTHKQWLPVSKQLRVLSSHPNRLKYHQWTLRWTLVFLQTDIVMISSTDLIVKTWRRQAQTRSFNIHSWSSRRQVVNSNASKGFSNLAGSTSIRFALKLMTNIMSKTGEIFVVFRNWWFKIYKSNLKRIRIGWKSSRANVISALVNSTGSDDTFHPIVWNHLHCCLPIWWLNANVITFTHLSRLKYLDTTGRINNEFKIYVCFWASIFEWISNYWKLKKI